MKINFILGDSNRVLTITIGEFMATALFSSSTLRHSSFLLNHSTAYHVAMVAAVLEFALEHYYAAAVFENKLIMACGIDIRVAGCDCGYHFGLNKLH